MAHIVLTTSSCYILIGTLTLLFHCAHLQNISLNSSLQIDQQNVNIVHPGEVVTFQCVTIGSSILSWSSPEYIRGLLEFVVVQSAGTVVASGFASAQLIDTYYSDGNGQPVIVSQLRIIIQRSVLNSSVTCHHAGGELTATIAFELSNTPVLTARKICPDERWVFTCEIRDSSILAWESNLYIGQHGERLEFLSAEPVGTTKFSGHQGVSAILTGSYYENHIQVLNSQLTIPEYHYHPGATAVVCVNVGLETRSNSFGSVANYTCNGTATGDTSLVLPDAPPITTIKTISTSTVGGGVTQSEDSGGELDQVSTVIGAILGSFIGSIVVMLAAGSLCCLVYVVRKSH